MAQRVPVNMKLPPSLKAWIDQQVAGGAFADEGRCVEAALKRARQIGSFEELENAAAEGLRSGPAKKLTGREWSRMSAEVRRRAAERAKSRRSA